MSDSASRLLEENVDRLVRRWADPVTEEHVDRACRRFVERLGREETDTASSKLWGPLVIAASLLVAGTVFWAILSSRDSRHATIVGAPQEEDPKKTLPKVEPLENLVEQLGSDSPDDRAKAMQEILKIGKDAVPFLKKAREKVQDPEVRARLEILLSDLDLPDPGEFFACRWGSRENLVTRGGGSRVTETALLAALQWLARHQNPDGSWSAEGFDERCTGTKCAGKGMRDYDAGVTGLALLAYLGAGYTSLSKDEYPDSADPDRMLKFGEVVKSAVRWLIARQDREGCVGVRGMKYMYNHAIATAALCEAYGMSRADPVRAPAQRAVDFLAASRNPGKGWRYSLKCGDNDTSVTGWAVMALKSAEVSSLKFPKESYEGAIAWLDEVSERNGYFQAGYIARGTGKVFVPGRNETFDHHPAMSAIAVASRLFLKKVKTDPQLGAVVLLMNDLPKWKKDAIDFYYWYYGSLAVFQYDGPGGVMWQRWNEALKNAIVPHQHPKEDGCRHGSWDSEQDRWGIGEGGRVYATAINALTLGIYYRYPIVAKAK